MPAGITNDKTGALNTPPSGVASIDAQVKRLQAEDTARKAKAAAEAEAGRKDN
jgi:hypothetical protein